MPILLFREKKKKGQTQHILRVVHIFNECMQDCHGSYQQGHTICGCAAKQGAGEATGSHSAGELVHPANIQNMTRQGEKSKERTREKDV